MRSCTYVPAGSPPPRQSRTRVPPPPRSGLRSPRRGRGRVTERGYGSRAQRRAEPRGIAHGAQRLRRVAEQRVALGEPCDERGMVLEARPVDDAAGRLGDRRVDERA